MREFDQNTNLLDALSCAQVVEPRINIQAEGHRWNQYNVEKLVCKPFEKFLALAYN